MLVEDDNNLREIYEARLQAEGYTLVSARDGEEALVLAKNEHPDLIISDIMMPKISGFEMLDILRNTDGLKDVKVIMLTALGQSDDQQRADRLGADRYLVKSQVTLEDIVKVAHELLQDNSESVTPEVPAIVPTPTTDAPAMSTPPVASSVPEPAMAVAPEPVMAQPATIPPTPVVVDQPLATPPTEPVTPPVNPVTDATSPASVSAPTPVVEQANFAQPTAQETAVVEAEIQDFVNGLPASPTATSADTSVGTTPTITVQPSMQIGPASSQSNDDKVMAEAVDSLMAETQSETDVPSTAPTTIVPQTAQQLPVPNDLSGAPSANGSVAIAHKKVISPLDLPPKQDINTLAELEEAKIAANAPPPPPVVYTSDNLATGATTSAPQPTTITPPASPAVTTPITAESSANPTSSTAPGDTIDPNHIAL